MNRCLDLKENVNLHYTFKLTIPFDTNVNYDKVQC